MELGYAWWNIIRPSIRRKKNPFKAMKDYSKSRGMSYWHDVRDWLGGYPMEFAGNLETWRFAKEQLRLRLINIKAGDGNTEYLFSRVGEENYFESALRQPPFVAITGNPYRVEGHAWSIDLGDLPLGDPKRLMMYENGIPMGWPNAALDQISRWGRGRYRIDGSKIIFSTLENDSPNVKRYSFRADFL
jgi:hypothetical protein